MSGPVLEAHLAKCALVAAYRRRAEALTEAADRLEAASVRDLAGEASPWSYVGGSVLRVHEEALNTALTAL